MRVQDDSEGEMIALLNRAFGQKIVSNFLPAGWSPDKGVRVTVESDGTPISSRGWTRETLRITVHGKVKSQVTKTMRLVDGFVLSPRQGHFLAVKPGAGMITTPDSRLGGFLSSATYRVAKPRMILQGDR